MNHVTLATGESVASNDPRWREECLARHRHVQTLWSLGSRAARADYVDAITRKDGEQMACRVRADFLREWEERRRGAECEQ